MPWFTNAGRTGRVMGFHRWCAALAVALLVGSSMSCNARNDPVRPLIIVISGDTAGWIVPCGCASNQSGGLLRRGSYLDDLREDADVLLLDAGGAAAGLSPYDRAKFEAIVRGELQMGVKAHNLGASEVSFGQEYLSEVSRTLKPPFVSCNVKSSAGELIVPPVIHTKIAGRRVAVIGVLSPHFRGASLQIDPPLPSILETLANNEKEYDHLLVLAYMSDEELRDLAGQLPEADAIVGGPTGQSIAPERMGRTWLASATNKGRFLVELRTSDSMDAAQWQARVVEMNDRFADDPEQRQNLDQFYSTLERHDFAARETEFAKFLPGLVPPGDRLAGTSRCAACHAEDHHGWEYSRHAHAWNSLKKTGAHVDSYCQQCHTTAYGWPGGFESAQRTPALVNIGCETCHGASQDHADDPQVRTARFQQASQQCVHCHDRENSPLFAYDAYWNQIQHGRVLPPPADEPALPKESG